jgi:hypothetical protein
MTRKKPIADSAVAPENQKWIGKIESHFLDSGAFTLKTRAAQHAKETGQTYSSFFDSKEHWEYLNNYATFIKENQIAIDLYANVDVMPDFEGKPHPKLTYRNQKYLETEHDLTPVPVVHFGTDLKWLRKYMEEGYEMIGLGGLVGNTAQDNCRQWIDRCFDLVCDGSSRLPKVKVHGFGVTVYDLLIRYPWYSVDSTSWTKVGAFGGILIPHKRRGKFIFDEQPYLMKVSMNSPDRKMLGRHFLSMSKSEQDITKEWLEFIQLPLGKFDKDGEITEVGVITHHAERRAANLHFFEQMCKSLPQYPWAFTSKRRKGFGLI